MSSTLPSDPWVHRSEGMRCRTCIWFVPKNPEIRSDVGRCRRHAPTMNGYPVVLQSDWCGDHRLSESVRALDMEDAKATHPGSPAPGMRRIFIYSPVQIAECGGPCERFGPEACDCGALYRDEPIPCPLEGAMTTPEAA